MNTNKARTADIVIVGAGVMGASIAFQLAKRRAGRIVVLDKDYVGQGASGRSSGLVRMHYTFPPEVQLAVKSLEFFQHWMENVGQTGEFHKVGFLRIVSEINLDRLKANVAMMKSHGVKVEILDRTELAELEPDWNFDDVPAAAYEADAGYGDGGCVAQDFMASAREMGVDYRPRTRVTGFLVNGSRLQGVATEQGELQAQIVVSAIGPWSKPLFQKIGVDLPIETEFHQVALLCHPSKVKSGGCACIDSTLASYFRPDGSDKTLVGDFHGERGIDPDQFPQRPSQEWLEDIIERTSRRIPKLQNAGVMRGITGIYDRTPDSRPLLGKAPGVEGLYVCAGFSGTGFKISPAIGLVMTELLLDGRGGTVDITAFDPERIAKGRPIRAEFEYLT